MMASVFASRIIGLVREMAIAWTGGTGHEVDAYQIAFALPEILNHVVASGFCLSPLYRCLPGICPKAEKTRGLKYFRSYSTDSD